jgi:outer membrane protein insertion porin family
LGYFSDIAVNPTPVQGSNDQVDLNVAVEETLSSSIKGGLGYGQDAGAIFNFQINQRNFRGTGRNLNVGASYSSAEKSVNVSSTNPYFTKNGVSQSIGLSYSETDPSQINQSSYLIDQANLNVTHGFPLNEDDTVYVGLGAEYYDITTGTATPAEIDAEVAKNGNKIINYKVNANFTKDTRDRSLFPTEGSITRVGVEVATPGSDTQYFKSFVNHKSYLSLGESAVLTGRAEIAYGDGYGDTEALPFFKNYYSGGIDSVRGFKSSSLGPRYSDTGTVKGGSFETNASIGLVTPFILAPNNDSLKTEFFVDAGNVFTHVDDFDSKEIRYSGGVGLQYFSPFGIIALSYAKPFNLQAGDDEENFQFSIGLSY